MVPEKRTPFWGTNPRFCRSLCRGEILIDGVNIKGSASYDSYFQTRRAMNDNRVLMPVPTSVLEDNTNIEQNLGY